MTDPTAQDDPGAGAGETPGTGADTPPLLSRRMTRALGAVMCGAHVVFSVAATLLAPVVRAGTDPQATITPSAPAVLGLVGVSFGAVVFLVALWYPAAGVLRRIGAVVLAASTVLVLLAVVLTSPIVGAVYAAEVAFVAIIAAVLVKLPKQDDVTAADARRR